MSPGVLDLLAILPALLAPLTNARFRVVSTFQVLRALRVHKLMKLAAELARASENLASGGMPPRSVMRSHNFHRALQRTDNLSNARLPSGPETAAAEAESDDSEPCSVATGSQIAAPPVPLRDLAIAVAAVTSVIMLVVETVPEILDTAPSL